MATDSQGNNFVFGSSTLTVTSVNINLSADVLDASHLGLASGSYRLFQEPALLSENELSCEALGTTLLVPGATGTLTFADFSYAATVQSSSVAYSVGELVRQSLTFKIIPSS
jgi:hypothetical protein